MKPLREASYVTVQYIPRKDVAMSLLERTDHTTYCPYEGDCVYYSSPLGGERSVNAVWAHETPLAAVAKIKDHVASIPIAWMQSSNKPNPDAQSSRPTPS